MKKLFLLASVAVASALGMNAEVASTLYLIGEPAGGWDTSKGVEMTKTADGVFELDVELKGKNSFGFVKQLNSNGDWDAFNSCRYTPASAGTVPVIGENDMIYTGDTTDYSWDLDAGNYKFIVDTNAMKFILEANGDIPTPPATQLYFTGEVNDWSFVDEYIMEADGNIYTYSTGVIRGGVEFKLSDRDWKTAYTTLNTKMTTGTYTVVTGDGKGNMAFVEDIDNPELILDTEAMTLTVKGTMAAVENVAVDSADTVAEYYNMQGVKVESPVAGLYLERRGNKVAKVYIK